MFETFCSSITWKKHLKSLLERSLAFFVVCSLTLNHYTIHVSRLFFHITNYSFSGRCFHFANTFCNSSCHFFLKASYRWIYIKEMNPSFSFIVVPLKVQWFFVWLHNISSLCIIIIVAWEKSEEKNKKKMNTKKICDCSTFSSKLYFLPWLILYVRHHTIQTCDIFFPSSFFAVQKKEFFLEREKTSEGEWKRKKKLFWSSIWCLIKFLFDFNIWKNFDKWNAFSLMNSLAYNFQINIKLHRISPKNNFNDYFFLSTLFSMF